MTQESTAVTQRDDAVADRVEPAGPHHVEQHPQPVDDLVEDVSIDGMCGVY